MSKYYKSSDSFQPEEIVKVATAKDERWKSVKVTASPPDHPPEQPATVQGHRAPLAEAGEDSATPPPAGGPTPPDTSQTDQSQPSTDIEQSSAPAFNPADYMEMAIAEARIEEAYQRGLQDGKTISEEDFGDALRSLLSSCQQLDTLRETLISNSRKEVMDFALAIAERVVRISVREQDRTIRATIDEALQQAVKSDEFIIYLHPEDYETISAKTDEFVAGLSGLNNVVVKQDNSIDRGGAKIESDNCTIDATLVTQFDVIREELHKKQ